MKRLISLTAAAAMLLASCWSPPFNEEISLSVIAMGKMDKVYEFTSGLWFDPNNPRPVQFLPNPASAGPGGFVAVGGVNPDLYFVVPFGAPGGGTLPTPTGPTADPFTLGYFGPAFLAAAVPGDILAPAFDFIVYSSVMTGTFSNLLSQFAADIGLPSADLYILGVHQFPDPNPALMRLHILAAYTNPVDPADRSLYELAYSLDTAPVLTLLSNINSDRFGPLVTYIPADENFNPVKVGYFFSLLTRRSYINFKNGSEYRTTTWPASSEGSLEINIRERILAVLTSGEILASDGDYGIVYDPSGGRKYKFPMGEMQFGYEAFVDNVPTLFFSRMYRNFKMGGNLSFEVFSIRTADLSRLQ